MEKVVLAMVGVVKVKVALVMVAVKGVVVVMVD